MFCVDGAALNEKSDEEGFLLVMPNGYQNSWNGGTCCGGASGEQLDDVALFRAIFEEVGKHVNIDLGRVYATGLSNGAYMSYRLGCDAADLFVAVAPGAGAVGKNDIGGGTNPALTSRSASPASGVRAGRPRHCGRSSQLHSAGAIPRAHGHEGRLLDEHRAGGLAESAAATRRVSRTPGARAASKSRAADHRRRALLVRQPRLRTGGGAIGAAFVGANSEYDEQQRRRLGLLRAAYALGVRRAKPDGTPS